MATTSAPASPGSGIPLDDCPASPNCVCTLATRASQSMVALNYRRTAEEVMQAVVDCVQRLPRAEIHARTEFYLHVVFRSQFLGFADDVEFYIDAASRSLHFRSASRLGYYDFGVNRQRMQAICRMLEPQLS